MQATVHTFDPVSGDGSVITDNGLVIPFDAATWSSGPARFFRVGQRVRIELSDQPATGGLRQSDGPTITAMTFSTFAD